MIKVKNKKNIFYTVWWVVIGFYFLASLWFSSPEVIQKAVSSIVEFVPLLDEYHKSSPFPDYTKGLLSLNITFLFVSFYLAFVLDKRVIDIQGTKADFNADNSRIKFVIILYLFVFISLGSSEVVSAGYKEHWFGGMISNMSKNKLYHSILYTLCSVSFSILIDMLFLTKTQYDD